MNEHRGKIPYQRNMCSKAFTEKDKDTSELDALEDLNAMNYMHWTLVLVQIRQRLPVGSLNGGDNAPFT